MLGAGRAAAALDAAPSVEQARPGDDEQRAERAGPARPERQPHAHARQKPSEQLRQPGPQRDQPQPERDGQGDAGQVDRRTGGHARRDPGQEPRREQRAPLAHEDPPADADDFVPIGLTQGVVGEAMKAARPPGQAIDPPGQRPRDGRHRHEDLRASLTAVP